MAAVNTIIRAVANSDILELQISEIRCKQYTALAFVNSTEPYQQSFSHRSLGGSFPELGEFSDVLLRIPW